MASLTSMSLLSLLVTFATVKNSASTSPYSPGPTPDFSPQLPVSPSYGPSPSPVSDSAPVFPPSLPITYPVVSTPSSYPPASELTPIYSPPIPAYYPDPEVPTPGPDVVPTSPPSPSTPNPVVLAPSSYPPTEPAPISSPPLPAYNPYYPEPSPGPTATPPSPSSPMPDPVVPAPSSYPPTYVPAPTPEPVAHPGGIKAAYWPSFDEFPASSIDTSYFTHIYYAFLLVDPISFKLNVTSFDQTKIPEFMGLLYGQNPPVKTLLSSGGGVANQTVFSPMAMTRKTRLVLINSTIEVARIYGFDGVDLDWQFPATAEDMMNLAILYKESRKALHDESKACRKPRLLLTSAVYYASTRMSNGVSISYPIGAIREYVDWVNPMCYDYRGIWENFTGEHSALYDSNSNLSTDYGIGSWLPAYGHSWKLQDPNVTGIVAPAMGPDSAENLKFHPTMSLSILTGRITPP